MDKRLVSRRRVGMCPDSPFQLRDLTFSETKRLTASRPTPASTPISRPKTFSLGVSTPTSRSVSRPFSSLFCDDEDLGRVERSGLFREFQTTALWGGEVSGREALWSFIGGTGRDERGMGDGSTSKKKQKKKLTHSRSSSPSLTK